MSVTLLDGGMGQELVARSGRPPTPLWSTQVMLDAPHLVREVHDAYFAAGAEIATANSYAVHHDRLRPAGIDGRFRELHETACRLAVAARDAHGAGRVAGALGPIGRSYRPEAAPPPAEAAALYAEIAAIQAPMVDLLILETMSGLAQAEGGLMGAMGAGRPVWLAVSVADGDGTRLRSGEPVAGILGLVERFGPEALLVNCSTPEATTEALAALAGCPVPLGAYANGFAGIAEAFRRPGATVALLETRPELDPVAYAAFAETWVGQGATIVGGCCEIGPAHIAELARRLKDQDA